MKSAATSASSTEQMTSKSAGRKAGVQQKESAYGCPQACKWTGREPLQRHDYSSPDIEVRVSTC